jgi:3-oxoacyl-[acyl-carrier-protein] synthase-3
MSLNEVYITNTSSFFPNNPVSNDEMEEYLGYINDAPSRSKAIVLRNNGIKNRFYALTKEGVATHTNAEMTALAVKKLFEKNPDDIKKIELLSTGTSTPDQLMPSHGVMVHGYLPETNPIEVVSPAGVCCAGMHAFKYAYLATKAGEVQKSVATGSERFSISLLSANFEDEAKRLSELAADPYIGFEKEFLRWMLSDGAAAFQLSNKKNEQGISLKVEWMEGYSYANELEPCMYQGCEKLKDGSLKSYKDYEPHEIMNQSLLSIKQDVKLLSKNIVLYGGYGVKASLDKHGVKWFVNLSRVGNVGAASVYFMVDELFHSGKLKVGDKIYLLVPESGRFSYMYSLLTVC